MPRSYSHLLEFGEFRLDLEKKVLWHAGEPVQLPAKAVEVLCELVGKRGEVVTKDELLDSVWSNSFVEESVLAQNVHHLRKTLKELGAGEDRIQTIPRRGYRFTGEVVATRNDDEILIEHEVVERRLIAEDSDDALSDRVAPASLGTPLRKPFTGRIVFFLLALLLLLPAGYAIWQSGRSGEEENLREIKSIAVLPLRSFDADSHDESLRLRIADALITKLGNLDQISVRPTNSILQFAGTEQDAIEIGKTLKVDAVLEGRLQEESDRLRVTLQLVSVKTGEQLWSEQFDGRADQILVLQDTITERLRQKLAFEPTEKFREQPTESQEAYETYLKGRYFWNQRTPDGYFKAIDYFEEAVRLDPNFALAYSGMADSYVLINRRYITASEEALPKAEESARKALELGEDRAEAQASMALVKSVHNRNWTEAEYHFRRAIELNPNYALAFGWYGMVLSGQKRFEEAEAQLRKAEQLDPTSRNIAVYLAANSYHARDFERAIAQSREALELDGSLSSAYVYLSKSYEQKGMYDAAVEAELERQRITDPQYVEALRASYTQSGIRGFWLKQIEIRRGQEANVASCGYDIATRYALLGQRSDALRVILERSASGGTCWNSINVEPAFDPLREDPIFLKALKEMGIG